jgi:hypothetical protein
VEYAGPVWSLDYLGNDSFIIIGKISYNMADTGMTDGLEYLNVVSIKDGFTTKQLWDIGIVFMAVEVLGPDSILIVDEYIGIIKWSNQDMPFYEWRLIVEPPEYLVVGCADTALAVSKDGFTLSLVDIAKGKILKKTVLSSRVVGRPIADESRYLIPVNGGLLVLDKELNRIGNYLVEGLKGSITLIKALECIYMVSESNITMIIPIM